MQVRCHSLVEIVEIRRTFNHTLGSIDVHQLFLQRRPRPTGITTEPPTFSPDARGITGYVHAEWNGGHSGFHGMEVEVREEAPAPQTTQGGARGAVVPPLLATQDQPALIDGQIVQVRVEEVLLVVLVLLIWVGAIALFFNRWGKIRMLEPYQPKFHQQPHRPSCPLAPLSPPSINHQQRMSFSKYNVNALTDPLSVLPSPIIRRPRQNSVFVGSSIFLNPPPRRVKSATDIHNMGATDHSPTTSLAGSVIPIINRDRRPSLITIERPERPIFISRRRPSITIERPPYQCPKGRRSSCFVERPGSRHRNFISFEHPERRTPSTLIINERSCSYHQPTISFETPMESLESTESPESPKPASRPPFKPKISRSFEQPPALKPKPERMANSLDVSSTFSIDRRYSIPEEDRSSPVIIHLDDMKVTAPLLENIKSSDV
ncbi:hypothetical protein GWI33_014180 [Rhynchophorus ferrugineus]|uniref:Fibronectin type III domain-containing protein n=1 Tax=Rhynchophorus ferrugineus TaxID=354439 RepID=A0A834M756_RHYFE|nr:hypothetical protein GWI33_014180 [Rhynchophorus ferrugineus]